MFLNPFFEGLICIIIAIGCYVLGVFIKSGELSDLGKLMVGAGIGYIGGAKVVAPTVCK